MESDQVVGGTQLSGIREKVILAVYHHLPHVCVVAGNRWGSRGHVYEMKGDVIGVEGREDAVIFCSSSSSAYLLLETDIIECNRNRVRTYACTVLSFHGGIGKLNLSPDWGDVPRHSLGMC